MPGKPKNSDLIRLGEVPKLILELTGVVRVRSTIWSWTWKGRSSYSGQKIKLKTTKRLGMVYTTKTWLEEFIREIG